LLWITYCIGEGGKEGVVIQSFIIGKETGRQGDRETGRQQAGRLRLKAFPALGWVGQRQLLSNPRLALLLMTYDL
jgi:hypothetical protein